MIDKIVQIGNNVISPCTIFFSREPALIMLTIGRQSLFKSDFRLVRFAFINYMEFKSNKKT